MRRKQRLGDVFLPLNGVITRGVEQDLLHQACLDLVAVAARIQRVILLANLKDGASVDVLVDFLVAATLQALTKVLVIDKVFGRSERPTKRLAKRTRIARIALMIEIERAILAVGHDVAHPNSLRLVIDLMHQRLPSHTMPTRNN